MFLLQSERPAKTLREFPLFFLPSTIAEQYRRPVTRNKLFPLRDSGNRLVRRTSQAQAFVSTWRIRAYRSCCKHHKPFLSFAPTDCLCTQINGIFTRKFIAKFQLFASTSTYFVRFLFIQNYFFIYQLP